jgi:GT2 family glycosyltransferase
MNQPKVSIIILNWNGKKYLKKCLDSVFRINYKNYEVIFVDNASTDDSVAFVKKRYTSKIRSRKLKLVLNDKNYGFAEGNNIGVRYAKGDYIFFLNQDTYIDKDCIKNLVDCMKISKAGICGAKVLDYDNPRLIQSKGAELDIFGSPYLIDFNKIEKKKEEEKFKIVSWIPGCALFIKKEVLKKLKYCFDPSFFCYFEDVDLCWRVRLLGYTCVVCPKAIVYHKANPSISPELIFLNSRNRVLSFRKNLSFPFRQILALVAFIRGYAALFYWFLQRRIPASYLLRFFKSLFIKPNYDVDTKKVPFSLQLSIFKFPRIEKYKGILK